MLCPTGCSNVDRCCVCLNTARPQSSTLQYLRSLCQNAIPLPPRFGVCLALTPVLCLPLTPVLCSPVTPVLCLPVTPVLCLPLTPVRCSPLTPVLCLPLPAWSVQYAQDMFDGLFQTADTLANQVSAASGRCSRLLKVLYDQ